MTSQDPQQVTDVQEAEIAVGNLAGVAPSRIARHALIVLDTDGDLKIATSCCKNELAGLIAQAGGVALREALQPGPCQHGETL